MGAVRPGQSLGRLKHVRRGGRRRESSAGSVTLLSVNYVPCCRRLFQSLTGGGG